MPRINTELDKYYGIGDLVCLAWIAEGARGGADPVTFHAKPGGRFEVLELLGQDVSDSPENPGTCIYPSYEHELKDRGRKPRVDYIRDLLGMATPLARPTARVSQDDLDWARKTRDEIGGDELVLLFPQTHWVPREWPATYWVDLGWQLAERNVKLAAMLTHEDPRFISMPLFYYSFSISKVAALMSLATLVVGVDSGPAHLAATIGVPTIALSGPTRPECVFGHVPEVIALTSHGEPGCAGCHFGAPFRAACDQGCQVLYALRPHEVLGRIVSELALIRRGPRGKALSFAVREDHAAN